MERFPIIYINKQFIYYRRPEETYLKDVSMSNVNKNCTQDTVFDYFYNRYFISTNKNEIDEMFEVLKVQAEPYFQEKKKRDSESYLDRAKRKYEVAKREYELMLKIKENYENKKAGEKNEQT